MQHMANRERLIEISALRVSDELRGFYELLCEIESFNLPVHPEASGKNYEACI